MELLADLKTRYHTWKEARFLRKHGCETRAEYNRRYDPDFNIRANRIKDMYHGYPYIHVFQYSTGDPWARFGDWMEGLAVIKDWCRENCQDKWREDFVGVHYSKWNGWEVNCLSNDTLFFAFKNQEDAVMFKLHWGQS